VVVREWALSAEVDAEANLVKPPDCFAEHFLQFGIPALTAHTFGLIIPKSCAVGG
jgi:hypothetical protein